VLQYLVRRLLMLIFVFFAVSFLTFLLMHLAPGDPARLMGGLDATDTDVELIRKRLQLDRPIFEQYFLYITKLLRGDMGESLRSTRPVAVMIASRYPYTFVLAIAGMVIAVAISLVAGTIAAVKNNSVFDYASVTFALLGVSMPDFWKGMMLMILFALLIRWLPASGAGESIFSLDGLRHLILPALTLGLGSAAYLTRLTRSSLLEVLNEDYINTARSKGLRERVVVLKHALRNALLPVVTMIGIQFGLLLGGAVIIEKVFAWPGIGRLTVDAIYARDFPVVQGCVLVFAMSFALMNLAVDVLYTYINPTIRLR
jgi:peptide/nickel transport system permease protein